MKQESSLVLVTLLSFPRTNPIGTMRVKCLVQGSLMGFDHTDDEPDAITTASRRPCSSGI